MHLKIRLVFICILLSCYVSAQGSLQLSGKTFPEQCLAIDSLVEAVGRDSTLKLHEVLQRQLKGAIQKNNRELEMLIQLRLLFHDYSNKEIADSRYLLQVQTLIQKCTSNKWHHLAAIAYEHEALYWRIKDSRTKEFECHLKAYENYKDLDPSFFVYKKHRLRTLGEDYNRFGDKENALKYFYLANEIPPVFDAALLNDIALTYRDIEAYDSSLKYFDLLYVGSVENGNKIYALLAQTNKVGIFTKQKKYDTALAMVKAYMPLVEKRSNVLIKAAEYERLGYLYLMLGNPQEAEKNINIALETFRTISPEWYNFHLHYSYSAFRHMSQTKAALNKHAQAYAYADSAIMVKDSSYNKFNIVKLKEIEKELGKAKLDYINQSLVFKQQQVQHQRNLWIVTVIAATSIILFVLYRYRVHKQKLEHERDVAALELKVSEDKLSAFTTSIFEKNKLLEDLQEQLKRQPADESNGFEDKLDELKSSTILTDSEWEDFKHSFNTVHKGYISRLQERYTDLTPAEVRYFVLAKLGMDNKEMASVLGIAPSSARTLKSRIIKKLSLEGEQDLADKIQTI